MLEDRGDAEGARTAYQQAIDAGWEFADDLRDKLSPPAEDDSEDEALIQDGHEDRRPLQSHFGAWVVCAERLGPFQVAGLASDGTPLATLDYSFPLPPDDGFPDSGSR